MSDILLIRDPSSIEISAQRKDYFARIENDVRIATTAPHKALAQSFSRESNVNKLVAYLVLYQLYLFSPRCHFPLSPLQYHLVFLSLCLAQRTAAGLSVSPSITTMGSTCLSLALQLVTASPLYSPIVYRTVFANFPPLCAPASV